MVIACLVSDHRCSRLHCHREPSGVLPLALEYKDLRDGPNRWLLFYSSIHSNNELKSTSRCLPQPQITAQRSTSLACFCQANHRVFMGRWVGSTPACVRNSSLKDPMAFLQSLGMVQSLPLTLALNHNDTDQTATQVSQVQRPQP